MGFLYGGSKDIEGLVEVDMGGDTNGDIEGDALGLTEVDNEGLIDGDIEGETEGIAGLIEVDIDEGNTEVGTLEVGIDIPDIEGLNE